MLAHNICVLVQATHELGIEPVFLSLRLLEQQTSISAKLYASRLLGGGPSTYTIFFPPPPPFARIFVQKSVLHKK